MQPREHGTTELSEGPWEIRISQNKQQSACRTQRTCSTELSLLVHITVRVYVEQLMLQIFISLIISRYLKLRLPYANCATVRADS